MNLVSRSECQPPEPEAFDWPSANCNGNAFDPRTVDHAAPQILPVNGSSNSVAFYCDPKVWASGTVAAYHPDNGAVTCGTFSTANINNCHSHLTCDTMSGKYSDCNRLNPVALLCINRSKS